MNKNFSGSIKNQKDATKEHDYSLTKQHKSIQDILAQLIDVKDQMTWKTELSDFTQVKRRFDNFSEIENIKKLELEYLPKIRKYIDDMNIL